MTAYNSKGRFIPDILVNENANWNNPDIQIDIVSLPNDYDDEQLDGEELLLVSMDEGKTFVVYIPEMDLDKIKDEKGAAAIPQVELMVTANGNEYGPYPIDLGEYDGEFTGEHYHALLRNHKYTFNINSVTVGPSTELEIEIVTSWQNSWQIDDDNQWDYENISVTFLDEEHLFKRNVDPEADSNSGTVYFEEPQTGVNDVFEPQRTVIITQNAWLEGTFQLSQPAKGTWTIALYGDDNTLNSQFRIDIWVPNEADEANGGFWQEMNDAVTGNVGEDVRFRIIPVSTNNETTHNKARIVMICTTFDDQIVEINLPDIIENKEIDIEQPPTVENHGYYYVKQYYSGFGSDGEDETQNNNANN